MKESVESQGSEVRNSFASALEDIIEWSDPGPGPHNILRITADQLEPRLEQLLRDHGYRIRRFDDLTTPEKRKELEELLVNAQSYTSGQIKEKDAIIVSPRALQQAKSDPVFVGNWALNSQYMVSLEDS